MTDCPLPNDWLMLLAGRRNFFVYTIVAVAVTFTFFSRTADAYSCKDNLDCIRKASSALKKDDLDAAIYYLERDIELAEELLSDYDEAEIIYHAAGAMLVGALYKRAAVLGMNGFHERSIIDLEYLIELQNKYPIKEHEVPLAFVYGILGSEYQHIADYEQSIASTTNALKEIRKVEKKDMLDQEQIDFMYMSQYRDRGMSYFLSGDLENSQKDIVSALKLMPDDESLMCIKVKMAIASKQADLALEALEEGFHTCNEYYEQGPLAQALDIIYDSLREQGSFPDGEQLFQEAADAVENDDYESAVVQYEACTMMEPMNSVYTYNLALTRALGGENDFAIEAYYRYLYLNPDADDREDVLAAIDELLPDKTVLEMVKEHNMESDEDDDE